MELLNIKDIVNQFKENYTYMNEDGVVKKMVEELKYVKGVNK